MGIAAWKQWPDLWTVDKAYVEMKYVLSPLQNELITRVAVVIAVTTLVILMIGYYEVF